MAEPSASTYSLDAADVIVAYGGDWVRFARANGAPELEDVLGRSIWDYVAGLTARALYAVLFQRVRVRREPVRLPFRCDSPSVFRFMELDIGPGDGRMLHLAGRLLRVQARPYLPLVDRLVPRSSSTLLLCSVCRRAQLEGTQWMEAEVAVQRLGLFASSRPPELSYSVCDDCFSRVEEYEGQPDA